MVINFTKKVLQDLSFAILFFALLLCIGGTPARKLTTAAMADNTDSSEESNVTLDIFQSLRETKESEKNKVSCHQMAEHKCCKVWMAIYFCQMPEHGVNLHDSYRTNRKQSEHNIRILKVIH
ncbi:hypothetical protein AMECASPLE_038926 [Ameca splendens]|uniref:Phytosulfokine-beta n=1 Tax=Ameca splendens TaxID=208324 RepID=A0ABV0Y885_9TELE